MDHFKYKKLDWQTAPAHWIMAKMGKTVLRPGGLQATDWLITNGNITDKDIVEIAPGLGITASRLIQKKPKSYAALDKEEAAAQTTIERLNSLGYKNANISIGDAQNLPFDNESKDLIIGEAMLSMQPKNIKEKIFSEVYRVLKNNGQYCIHELVIEPKDIDLNIAAQIAKDLSQKIKVSVQFHTTDGWTELLEKSGFKVVEYKILPMHLLEPKRLIQDEGLVGTLKFIFNVLTHKQARKRLFNLKNTFKKNNQHLNAIAIIAEKQTGE